MKTLLVYTAGNDVEFYVLYDVTQDQLRVLEKANGHLVNYDMEKDEEVACDKIGQAVTASNFLPGGVDGSPIDGLNVLYEDWASIWLNKKVNLANLNDFSPFDRVFHTGFAP